MQARQEQQKHAAQTHGVAARRRAARAAGPPRPPSRAGARAGPSRSRARARAGGKGRGKAKSKPKPGPEPPDVTPAELKRRLDDLKEKLDGLPVDGVPAEELDADCGQSVRRWRGLKRAKYAHHMRVEQLTFDLQEERKRHARTRKRPEQLKAAEERIYERNLSEDYLRYRLAQGIAKRMLGPEGWERFKAAWAVEWPQLSEKTLPIEPASGFARARRRLRRRRRG